MKKDYYEMGAEINSAKCIYFIKTFHDKLISWYVYLNFVCFINIKHLNDLPPGVCHEVWSAAHFTRGSVAGRGGVPRLPRYPCGRGGERPHTEEPGSQEQGTINTHRLKDYSTL